MDNQKSSIPPAPEASSLPERGPGVHQETIELPGGGTLRYTISVPAGYDAHDPAALVVALHYAGEVTPFYGRDVLDKLFAPALAALRPIIVAPDALEGGTWLTATNERAVIWLTRSVMKTYAIDPKRVLLTGFSMGGKGTWYLGGRHQDLFTAAIPIAGGPAGAADWRIPVLVIHAEQDEMLPIGPTRRHVEELRAKGARVELRAVAELTHYQTALYAGPLRDTVGWLMEVWK